MHRALNARLRMILPVINQSGVTRCKFHYAFLASNNDIDYRNNLPSSVCVYITRARRATERSNTNVSRDFATGAQIPREISRLIKRSKATDKQFATFHMDECEFTELLCSLARNPLILLRMIRSVRDPPLPSAIRVCDFSYTRNTINTDKRRYLGTNVRPTDRGINVRTNNSDIRRDLRNLLKHHRNAIYIRIAILVRL